jgi:DNA-binding NarL/FixJ family response regulator
MTNADGAACKVLLVDDTPDIRLVLRTLFGIGDSLEVVAEARDGLEAVQLSERHQPDVVVLDVAMPVMDGLEAIPEIRRVSPDSSIVMYSANDSQEIRAEALRLGATHFVQKGSDPDEVLDAVHEECANG